MVDLLNAPLRTVPNSPTKGLIIFDGLELASYCGTILILVISFSFSSSSLLAMPLLHKVWLGLFGF